VYSLIFLTLTAFTLSLILTPVVRDGFLRIGVLDLPDRVRKLHARPTPRIGGVPIATAYLGAFAILLLSPLKGGQVIQGQLSQVWTLLPAVGLIFATGLADDLIELKPWMKLAGQTGAAALAYWSGVQVDSIAAHPIPEWGSLPITLIWLVACTNAFNLIDGIDGLASGVGLFATVTIFLSGLLMDNVFLAFATAPLAGCLLGFLRYNFNPASIFLGDSGSLFIGFLLGCYGAIWSQKSATLLGMTAPLMALSIPLLDVGLSVTRRFLRGRPIFGADRGHIHHRLLERGLTPRGVALALYGVTGLAAAFSLLQTYFSNRFSGLIIVAFCGVAWMGIQQLGYAEFGAARRILTRRSFQGLVSAQLSLQKFQRDLEGCRSLEDAWPVVRDACAEFGFHHVRVDAGDRTYESRSPAPRSPQAWTVLIPLAPRCSATLGRTHRSANEAAAALFLTALQDGLSRRLREWEDFGAVAAPRLPVKTSSRPLAVGESS